LIVVMRDVLKVVRNNKELKKAIGEKKIKINGKEVREVKYPVGLFDVIAVGKDNYRASLKGKKMGFEEISDSEAGKKVAKIIGKKVLGKNKIQFNLMDGSDSIVVVIEAEDLAGNISEFQQTIIYRNLEPTAIEGVTATNSTEIEFSVIGGGETESILGFEYQLTGPDNQVLTDWCVAEGSTVKFDSEIAQEGNYVLSVRQIGSESTTEVLSHEFRVDRTPIPESDIHLLSVANVSEAQYTSHYEIIDGLNGAREVWLDPVTLDSGVNPLMVSVEDDAGNLTEFTIDISVADKHGTITLSVDPEK